MQQNPRERHAPGSHRKFYRAQKQGSHWPCDWPSTRELVIQCMLYVGFRCLQHNGCLLYFTCKLLQGARMRQRTTNRMIQACLPYLSMPAQRIQEPVSGTCSHGERPVQVDNENTTWACGVESMTSNREFKLLVGDHFIPTGLYVSDPSTKFDE